MTYQYDFISATDAKSFQGHVQSRSEDPDGPWQIIDLGVCPAGSDTQETPAILYWMFTRRTRKVPAQPAPSAPGQAGAPGQASGPGQAGVKPKPSKAAQEYEIEETAIEMWRAASEAEDGESYTNEDFYALQADSEQDRWRVTARKVLYGG